MEREPVQFLWQERPQLLNATRAKVADFLGALPEDVVFTSNATEGVNAVLHSLAFTPGDEILLTDHGYAACRNAADYVARRSGAKLTVARVPFPLEDPSQVTAAILETVTNKTKLALVDHVTSITGLVWPIKQIVAALSERGIDTLVDGAHAPGMVDLRLNELGAAYYAANFHKWGCAPKGAAVLWVRRDLQPNVIPPVISHGYTATRETRFCAMFDWTGTRDPTPYLCIPRALEFLASLCPGGFAEVRSRNRELALSARDILCKRLDLTPPAPDSMIGSLAALPIKRAASRKSQWAPDDLYLSLFERGFEPLVQPWPDDSQLVVRVSAQLYNEPSDYERFAEALAQQLGTTS